MYAINPDDYCQSKDQDGTLQRVSKPYNAITVDNKTSRNRP